MKEELISFECAKLAKKKGFNQNPYETRNSYRPRFSDGSEIHLSDSLFAPEYNICVVPTQSLLQRWIRESRGVHIEIHRNASGYFWSMCKSDGGTDLGWSEHTGPNDGGVWDEFSEALDNALIVQLGYDLPKDTKYIKHWGNYVTEALKKLITD
jgi:hypothetical protein